MKYVLKLTEKIRPRMDSNELKNQDIVYESIFYDHMFKIALDPNAEMNDRVRIFKIIFNLVWSDHHRCKLIKGNYIKKLYDMGN